MSLSRIQADRFVAPLERVSLAEVIKTSLATIRASSEPPSRLMFDAADDLPPVRGDRSQLVQMVDNLLSNALRYGCDGPDSTIEISLASEGRRISVTVTDHGPGISREHLPRVTERFIASTLLGAANPVAPALGLRSSSTSSSAIRVRSKSRARWVSERASRSAFRSPEISRAGVRSGRFRPVRSYRVSEASGGRSICRRIASRHNRWSG